MPIRKVKSSKDVKTVERRYGHRLRQEVSVIGVRAIKESAHMARVLLRLEREMDWIVGGVDKLEELIVVHGALSRANNIVADTLRFADPNRGGAIFVPVHRYNRAAPITITILAKTMVDSGIELRDSSYADPTIRASVSVLGVRLIHVAEVLEREARMSPESRADLQASKKELHRVWGQKVFFI